MGLPNHVGPELQLDQDQAQRINGIERAPHDPRQVEREIQQHVLRIQLRLGDGVPGRGVGGEDKAQIRPPRPPVRHELEGDKDLAHAHRVYPDAARLIQLGHRLRLVAGETLGEVPGIAAPAFHADKVLRQEQGEAQQKQGVIDNPDHVRGEGPKSRAQSQSEPWFNPRAGPGPSGVPAAGSPGAWTGCTRKVPPLR